eukprot:TRINITY_DN6557_c0_g1_i1.p1 TRINITY_DN6557_c0_g1~~TRINITY_DN6557_c0_g1_i1.p1  ORF type:complete len:228 (+),score=44.11 TRINITY_DN6557_c0_g1_i1:69-752(+)
MCIRDRVSTQSTGGPTAHDHDQRSGHARGQGSSLMPTEKRELPSDVAVNSPEPTAKRLAESPADASAEDQLRAAKRLAASAAESAESQLHEAPGFDILKDLRAELAAQVTRAQFWYYLDTAGETQGPFYPGQMREWVDAGYFTETQLVSPSFHGEVPSEFQPIKAQFGDSQYFVCDASVASRPPEELATQHDEPAEDDEALTKRLKQRLMNSGGGSGPAEKRQSDWR